MPDLEGLASRVRVLQIIALALLVGLLTFTGVVLFLRLGGQAARPAPAMPMVTYVALGMLVLNLPLSMLIPNFTVTAALKAIAAGSWTPSPGREPAPVYNDDSERVLAVRQTSLIITLALLEGPGFLGCIAYLLEGNPLALCVPAATVLAMLVHFPTKGRTLGWVETKLAEIDALRRRGA